MDKMADVLGRAGAWCGQNKYLSAIKNAFQNFMPLTIAGAIGVLWCNVLVNETTGLGMFFKPIMALDFLNPAFQAVNFCTISCITVGITLGIAQEIGIWNMGAEKAGYIPKRDEMKMKNKLQQYFPMIRTEVRYMVGLAYEMKKKT